MATEITNKSEETKKVKAEEYPLIQTKFEAYTGTEP